MPDYSTLSDMDLVALVKEGNQSSFTEIFERYKFVLHYHACKKMGNREDTKDIIQEVFVNFWEKRKTITCNSNLSGYLYTSLRNSILNHFAHQKVRTKYVDSMIEFADVSTVFTDHLVRERQFSEIIEAEIAALPDKMRLVFEMSRKLNLSHQEIAAELGITESTVNRQISNALKILRTKLGLFTYLLFLIQS
ncbi:MULTISPECIES: RNA polymerase sigma factor [Sphingobacterium]|uniref:RNA polymerase sigma factor n=1 Tax=Sphingobacterium TaxID=28453 RepID=UPI0013DCA338|nr:MULTISPECIES: RNA polymerase sigma-70 factor [unclassified Sphingobacterium]